MENSIDQDVLRDLEKLLDTVAKLLRCASLPADAKEALQSHELVLKAKALLAEGAN